MQCSFMLSLFFWQGNGRNMQILHEKDALHAPTAAEQVVPGAG